MQKIAKIVYPHLKYQWIPSTHMLTALGSSVHHLPGIAQGKRNGTSVMANIPWILLYLLATNTMRLIQKRHGSLRTKAFRILSSLVNLACSTLGEGGSRKISTYFGYASIDRDGMIDGDNAWVAHLSRHQNRCRDILISLGCGGLRMGAGLTDIGSSRCGVAAMMWHWVLLTHNQAKPGRNKDIHKTGQAILGETLAFISNVLGVWTAQQKDASTARLVALQPKGKQTNPAILSHLMRRRNKRAACRGWREDGIAVHTNVANFENKMSTVY